MAAAPPRLVVAISLNITATFISPAVTRFCRRSRPTVGGPHSSALCRIAQRGGTPAGCSNAFMQPISPRFTCGRAGVQKGTAAAKLNRLQWLMQCAYCSHAALTQIPSIPHDVCGTHAIEFWSGLVAFARNRAESIESHEPLCLCWACNQLSASRMRSKDASTAQRVGV
jgi:hypothetical protein